jgi:hypothetical protein
MFCFVGTHPVGEHDRHGGERLHGDAVLVHVGDALLGIPAVGLSKKRGIDWL